MKTNNPNVIGITMLIIGLGIVAFWGNSLYKVIAYPLMGTSTEAKIIGYKISRNGAKMVTTNRKLSGRSPFFEFISDDGQTIKSYSKSPQIFVLFNYEIGENCTVAYPKNNPEKAVIISWKEIPGLLLMITLGLLSIIVGKSYLFNK
jgi:hypothetical protein